MGVEGRGGKGRGREAPCVGRFWAMVEIRLAVIRLASGWS